MKQPGGWVVRHTCRQFSLIRPESGSVGSIHDWRTATVGKIVIMIDESDGPNYGLQALFALCASPGLMARRDLQQTRAVQNPNFPVNPSDHQ